MLRVLITIDSETHALSPNWRAERLTADIKRDLYGEIDGHCVGLEYQLGVLSKYGLKASFMVESLFSAVPEVGEQTLRDAVQAIVSSGNDVQVHPHPEWIPFIPELQVPERGHLLSSYTCEEQEAIIRFAAMQLQKAGAPASVAFRAGGFAANMDTMKALVRCGIRIDSSFNRTYTNGRADLPVPSFAGHVTEYEGVQELPVAVFEDFSGHFRPAQLCACSSDEMIHALVSAESAGWDFFVIVSHSFEMVGRRRHSGKPPVIRWEVVERFEKLCAFLAAHRDRFDVVRFSDLQHFNSLNGGSEARIRGRLLNTVSRVAQQAVSRIQMY